MKYYIIAGEASGDLHGGALVEQLFLIDEDADVRGWGGDQMTESGAIIVKHIRDLAFMGFVEVVRNLRTIITNLKSCKSDIVNYDPDALILIDYPGFNLRIAKWAKTRGITVLYYISPQIWAWNVKRVHAIKATVDQMYVILPFEKDFYKQFDYAVEYVGHPLSHYIRKYRTDHPVEVGKSTIALLPGSRKQEVSTMLPIFIEVARKFPTYSFEIAKAPHLDDSFYEMLLDLTVENVSLHHGKSYQLLNRSKAALTTSGTVTLETALFHVPQVVCYKGNLISFQIAKRLIRVPFISLVNLIVEEKVVEELIQEELTVKNLHLHLTQILDGEVRQRQLLAYQRIEKLLIEDDPSFKTASLMYHYLQSKIANG